jgi:hypothetical protein
MQPQRVHFFSCSNLLGCNHYLPAHGSMLATPITLIFLLFSLSVQAQNYTQSLKGRVVDADTKQPMEGVNIMLLNQPEFVGTTSQTDGYFKFENLKAGRYSIKFSMVGYHDAMLNNITVTSGKETVLNVEMSEKIADMQEVVVMAKRDKARANNEFAPISARSFSMEETKRYAGTLNDPARMVQTFPGVISANDENNAIVVRGNSPRGILWRLEGVEIPNPNHFAGSEGASGGGVAMLSANMLGKTDFLSGAFPAEYGNALSGVMDLNFRKGNNEKHEVTLQAGVLGAEAALEGPFSKKSKASYLVNYRYSTLELFALTGFKIGGDVTPKYQDLSFNFSFPTKRLGTFTWFGLGGLSGLGASVQKDTAQWQSIQDKTADNQHYYMGTTGFTHLLLPDAKTYIKTTLSFSYSNSGSNADTFSNKFEPTTVSEKSYQYYNARLAMVFNRKVDAQNLLRCGFYYTGTFYNLRDKDFNFLLQQLQTRVQGKGNTHLVQAYWQWKHRFSEVLSITSGMHFTYFLLNKRAALEPRANIEWKPAFNQALSVGVGLHNRTDAVSAYVSSVETANGTAQANLNLNMTQAAHAVLGYDFVFLKDFRLHAETYFQFLFQIPTGLDSNAWYAVVNANDGFVNFPLANKGKGMNYGLELTLEKFFSKNYFFLVTTSIFNSRYAGSDGAWRNTAYNGNYVLNVLGCKEFVLGKQKVNIIGITAKILYRGGMRITPIDLAQSRQQQTTVYDNSRAFDEKLPDYLRMDFGTYFRRNKKHWSWILTFDAQNIINRQNVAYKVYDPQRDEIRIIRNLGIIPVVSWKVEFGIKMK